MLKIARGLGQDDPSQDYMPGVDFTSYDQGAYSGVVSIPADQSPANDDSSFWNNAQIASGEIPDPNVNFWNQAQINAGEIPGPIPSSWFPSPANVSKTAPAPPGGGSGGDVGGLVGALAKGLKNLLHPGSGSPAPRALPASPLSSFPFNTQTLVTVGLVGLLALIAIRGNRR